MGKTQSKTIKIYPAFSTIVQSFYSSGSGDDSGKRWMLFSANRGSTPLASTFFTEENDSD